MAVVVALAELRVVHEGGLHRSGLLQGIDQLSEPGLLELGHLLRGLFRRLLEGDFVHVYNIAFFWLLVNRYGVFFQKKFASKKKSTACMPLNSSSLLLDGAFRTLRGTTA